MVQLTRASYERGIRFDRNELAGSFGDLGVAIPLLTAMIVINGLDAASVFILFGLLHIYTGFAFGLPIPVQPLKAMAAIMIASKLPASYLYGAGLVVGIFFLILALTNAIELVNKVIPKSVTRGIQLGLGLNLILIAFGFMQKELWVGWLLSAIGILITLFLYNNRRIPPALILVAIGALFSIFTGFSGSVVLNVGLNLPKLYIPTLSDIANGSVLLAIPQIPLSLGNSIIATSLLASDLFPHRKVTTKKLALTYGTMNLIAPFFSGIPSCHGAGGLAGHYRFGARTGGAVIIIGIIFTLLGLLYGNAVGQLLKIFPFAILGVLLFFSGLELTLTIKDVANVKEELLITLFVAALVIGMTYGYLAGMVAGSILYYLMKRRVLRLFG